ncbi:bifunctional riboflavin kinase/FAD synthetase [Geobacter argillaceus]|uniref:Riboflavin biosynthesis protein n=1 Tax=Geobacter argillaceus TaxID=345631 RepID=A0A562VLZ7_9BACT|nr:bifunctional riboflavin kinase/FAD synthetase [Geobacter argillaceus]TWJ18757.1 FMN adenylyltransferase /riboflavin kinase [Geobacter argillaceus]
MIVYRSLEEIQPPLVRTVVTIGNFDGVHLGHREIFRRVKRAARACGGSSVVLTFDPHPLKVLPTTKEVRLINTSAEKELLIEASGVDYLVSVPFTFAFARLTAREFVEQVLVGKLGVHHLIIGYDYCFGRGREGNVSFLKQLGDEFGFRVEVLEPLGKDGVVYSSSLVRELIRGGAVADVVRFLGRHYSAAGTVVHGHHRGQGLGFPTANLATDKEIIPAHGVYAVRVKVGEELFDGACNIGTTPTFGGDQPVIEVFLFDYAGDLYGREIRVYFMARLRDEKKFASPEELKEAIAHDVARCREILAAEPLIEYREYLEGV